MKICLKTGIFDMSNQKLNAVAEARDFVHLHTKLSQCSHFQLDSLFSALYFTLILGWDSAKRIPIVENKMNGFEKRAHIDNLFNQLSNEFIENVPKKILFHQPLIQEFRRMFNKTELEEAIDSNQDVNIVIGQYKSWEENAKEYQKVELNKKLGSNADAPILIFIIQNISQNPENVFVVYCSELVLYQRKKKQYQNHRNSYPSNQSNLRNSQEAFDQEDVGLRGSKGSTGVRLNNEQQQFNDDDDWRYNMRSDKENKDGPVQSIMDSNIQQGYCSRCQGYEIIDKGVCWRCFKKGNNEYEDIALFIVFVGIFVFLMLLNYYHGRKNGFMPWSQNYRLLNSASERVYQTTVNMVRFVGDVANKFMGGKSIG